MRNALWSSNVRDGEGFRALAYEIVTWTNPRAAGARLWGFVLRDGPAGGTGCGCEWANRLIARRAALVMEPAAREFDRACVADGRSAAAGHVPSPWPARAWRGLWMEQIMPGHDTSSRRGAAACGGARGWRQRAKVSMTIMRPPQQGHGGPKSSISSSSSSADVATARS